MRSPVLHFACVAIIGVCAFVAAEPEKTTVKVRIRLLDADTGDGMAGIIRVSSGEGKPLALENLFERRKGLNRSAAADGWYIVPASGAAVTLPRAALKFEALGGLETTLLSREIDLGKEAPEEIALRLPFLFRPEKSGLVAGNTHVHLRNFTKAQADDYLQQVPAADGLKVLFLSYLERNKDDESYITNQYPIGDPTLKATGIVFNNGEEHRHNFGAFGPGYGHVMLLNIKELVKPVSLGPGITGAGVDDRELAPGLDDARRQGGTILWCHNTNGYEFLPRALTGSLDALNVFDGSRGGTYEERYYRILNLGRRLPISTGTDWFIYDFARVYAKTPAPVRVAGWLDAVKQGRCFATNSPSLTLTVDGKEMGSVVALDRAGSVSVEASAIGRHDFQELQLVRNGKVIARSRSVRKDGGYRATLSQKVRIDEPSWFAVRIESTTRNELDHVLFAHSSPVYVDLEGKRTFEVESAQAQLKELEQAQADIRAKGRFSNDEARDKLLADYDRAATQLRNEINQRGK
jgi:hypothetical protein